MIPKPQKCYYHFTSSTINLLQRMLRSSTCLFWLQDNRWQTLGREYHLLNVIADLLDSFVSQPNALNMSERFVYQIVALTCNTLLLIFPLSSLLSTDVVNRSKRKHNSQFKLDLSTSDQRLRIFVPTCFMFYFCITSRWPILLCNDYVNYCWILL